MRRDDQRAAVVNVHERIRHRRNPPLTDLDQALATTAPSLTAIAPRCGLSRKSLEDLLEGQPRPRADVDLAKPLVRRDRQTGEVSERLSRLAGTDMIRRNDGGRRNAGEQDSSSGNLGSANIIEFDVELALEPTVRVPLRLPLPADDYLAVAHSDTQTAEARPAAAAPRESKLSASI